MVPPAKRKGIEGGEEASQESREKLLRWREQSEEERKTVERQGQARPPPVGKGTRAQLSWLASQGRKRPEMARQQEVSERLGRTRRRRFKEHGLAGLEEAPRCGRPVTNPPEEVSRRIQTAFSHARELGKDDATGTRDGLVDSLQRVKGVRLKRSCRSESFLAEGLKPGDTKQRGLASGSIPTSPQKGGP